MRGGTRRGSALFLAVVVLVVGGGLLWLVVRPPEPEPTLASVLLDDQDVSDVQPGFRQRMSEASEEPLPLPGWIPPAIERMVRVPNHVRGWVEPDSQRKVVVVGYRLQLPVLASAVFDGLVGSLATDASSEFAIAAVPGARGFEKAPDRPHGAAREYWGTFRQGSLVFAILVSSPDATDGRDVGVARRLVEAQAGKAPLEPSVRAPPGDAELAARFASGTLVALLAYVGLASLAAWGHDPLRRPVLSGSNRLVTPVEAGESANSVVDVTSTADRRRRAARLRLVLQLVGVAVASPGMFPFTWPLGLVFVAGGIALAGLPSVVAVRTDRHEGATALSPLFTGRRRLRVAAHSAASAVCVLAGLAGMLLFGVGTVITSPLFGLNVVIVMVSVALVVAGTLLYRRARRLAAYTAREVLRADPRPMVLYLRAFADDTLTIRSATYARPLLLERLSPRGFDRFEEVLARNLTAIGPVIAINPTGTDLAPLGAARETLDPDDWQSQVAQWMREARLIVFGAAPITPAAGLAWELATVDGQQRWASTLLVLPPLAHDVLRHRWSRFAPLLEGTTMADHPLPADPARTLVLTGSPSVGWSAVMAARRDEWTYAAALGAAPDRAGEITETSAYAPDP
jgi:hypothetical protein